MPTVTWKPGEYNYYAFLDECRWDPQDKKRKTRSIYLGNTVEKAERKLRQLVQDDEEYSRLVRQLRERRPEGKPPVDEAGKAARQLERLAERFQDKEVRAVIEAAVRQLRNG